MTTQDLLAHDDDREAGVAVVYEVLDPDIAFMAETVAKASSAIKVGDFEKAERQLRKALEKEPDHHQCRAYLAICVAALGRNLQEAEQLAKGIARDHRQDPVGHYALGQIKLLAGKRRSAFGHLAKARRLANADPEMMWHLDGLDPRRDPVLTNLHRNHFLNVLLGRLRAIIHGSDDS